MNIFDLIKEVREKKEKILKKNLDLKEYFDLKRDLVDFALQVSFNFIAIAFLALGIVKAFVTYDMYGALILNPQMSAISEIFSYFILYFLFVVSSKTICEHRSNRQIWEHIEELEKKRR